MRSSIALGLALMSGAAVAGPLGNVINGVTGVIGGVSQPVGTAGGSTTGTVTGTVGAVTGSVTALPPLAGASGAAPGTVALPSLINLSSPTALPGLDLPASGGDLAGLTVLQKGPDGSGYGDVLDVGQQRVIGEQVDGKINKPVLGTAGTPATANVSVLDGNSAAQGGVVDAAAISGNNAATGGAVGAAVLSGTHSGYGNAASAGALNDGDLAHVCIGASCVTPATVNGGAHGALPQTQVAPGVVVGGGASTPVTTANPVANVGVLTGDNAGTGGLVGVGVLAGNNSGSGSAAGACVLCGANSGHGNVGAAVLSGDNSGNGTTLGTAVLSGNNSGNGGALGAAVLSGNNSGNGGLVGSAVLSGNNSGNGGLIGSAVGSGAKSGNGGLVGVAVLSGPGSGNGGLLGISVLPTGGSSGGNGAAGALIPQVDVSKNVGGLTDVGVKTPVADSVQIASDSSVVSKDDDATDDATDLRRGACMIVVKNVKDETTQSMQKRCKF